MNEVPVKVYRTTDRLTVAAPTPGLLPDDLRIEITSDNHLVLDGEARGETAQRQVYSRVVDDGSGKRVMEEQWERLEDEWNVGPYHRELDLPASVDGSMATATYGNGVVVVTMPVAERTSPAELHLEPVGMGHGERVGSSSYPIRQRSSDEHRGAKNKLQAEHRGGRDPHDR